MALHTLDAFESCEHVVLPSGSCTDMVRNHYMDLFRGTEVEGRTRSLAGRSFELSEFIVKVLGVTQLGSGLSGRRVAYHHGCHALRGLGIREEPLALLRNSGAERHPISCTIWATIFPMAGEEVRPGDSMPIRLMRPSRPRSASWRMMKSRLGAPGP